MGKLLKIIGLLTVVLAGSCVIIVIAASNSPQVQRAVAEYNAPPIITLDEFNRLQIGMSYDEACRVVGAQGTLQSENQIAGVPGAVPDVHTVMYAWQNGDGSNANAIFQNGRLLQRAQFGLR